MDTTPLCTDLDGTLIRTDLLLESAVTLLKTKPWYGFAYPVWLATGGRPGVKRKIAQKVILDFAKLPYNLPFIDWLKEEKKSGRRIVLATAADRILAEPVANHLGIFDEVLASDGQYNMKGRNKLAKLKERFGKNFDYAGDHHADLPIWAECREAIVVAARETTLTQAKKVARVTRVFD